MIRRAVAVSLFAVLAAGGTMAVAPTADAASLYGQAKYAALLVDASSGEILYARQPDSQRHPASITKVMTLYLTFEEIEAGRLKLTDRVTLSAHAASRPPSKSGLKRGESLTVDQAVRLLATKSANDIAVALAERIAGSEVHFADRMNAKARELGMTNSNFANASGLPNSSHYSSARDIATLSRAMLKRFPRHYAYFQQQEFEFNGRVFKNHNHLLKTMPGVDGIKTGYTVAAGFTLAASAVRDGKRLIAVVLGGPSTAARDANVAALLDAGFQVLARRAQGQRITVAANMQEPDDMTDVLSAAIEQGSGEEVTVKGVVHQAAGNR